MISRTTKQFWKHYHALPREIQIAANKAYELWLQNPSHPSLQFKRVDSVDPIYSARVNRQYRALGILKKDKIVWFWIGKHAVYDRLLN